MRDTPPPPAVEGSARLKAFQCHWLFTAMCLLGVRKQLRDRHRALPLWSSADDQGWASVTYAGDQKITRDMATKVVAVVLRVAASG